MWPIVAVNGAKITLKGGCQPVVISSDPFKVIHLVGDNKLCWFNAISPKGQLSDFLNQICQLIGASINSGCPSNGQMDPLEGTTVLDKGSHKHEGI